MSDELHDTFVSLRDPLLYSNTLLFWLAAAVECCAELVWWCGKQNHVDHELIWGCAASRRCLMQIIFVGTLAVARHVLYEYFNAALSRMCGALAKRRTVKEHQSLVIV